MTKARSVGGDSERKNGAQAGGGSLRDGLRERVRRWSHGRWALPIAGLLGFLEGSFVIVAMEPLFIPLMASRGRGAWLVAGCLLIGNVLGGLLMYGLGAMLAEPVIEPFFAATGGLESYNEAMDRLKANGFIALFAVGVTPFPFQVGTAAAGAVGYSLPLFVLSVTASRGIRYFALAGLVMLVGVRVRDFIERHELEIFLIGAVVFAGLALYLFF